MTENSKTKTKTVDDSRPEQYGH